MEHQEVFQVAGLLAKYIKGELSSQEQAELEVWKNSSPQHVRLMEEFLQATFWEKKQVAEERCGKKQAFQKFIRWKQEYQHRRRMRRIGLGSAAAVVILFITVAGLLWRPYQGQEQEIVQNHILPAGESRAVLTLADGQKMSLDKKRADTLIQMGEVRINTLQGEINYEAAKHKVGVEHYNQLDIPRKGEYRLVLADGTRIWLNSESSLKYPVAFQGNERKVYLEGEAYFEVSKDEHKPFIVVSGESSIRVLGTSFNVRAYADEAQLYATLVEGTVRLSHAQQSLILYPDEQGVITFVSRKLEKRKVDANLYTAWKDGRFIFENQTLEEIMNTLGRWYDVKVFYSNEQVKQAVFNGNLKRYDNFDQIVKMLELTGVAHFKINGETIIISE